MNTFQKIESIKAHVLAMASESMVYTDWDIEFAASNVIGIPAWIKTNKTELSNLDLSELSSDDCVKLGFSKWNTETGLYLYLIPLYLFPFLPSDVDFTSVIGERVSRLEEISNDSRMGFLAYGISPTKL